MVRLFTADNKPIDRNYARSERLLKENEEKYLSSETLFSSFKTAVMNNGPNVPQYGTIQNVGDEGGEYIFIMRQGQPSPESREPVP